MDENSECQVFCRLMQEMSTYLDILLVLCRITFYQWHDWMFQSLNKKSFIVSCASKVEFSGQSCHSEWILLQWFKMVSEIEPMVLGRHGWTRLTVAAPAWGLQPRAWSNNAASQRSKLRMWFRSQLFKPSGECRVWSVPSCLRVI